jgi:hypothetical protein
MNRLQWTAVIPRFREIESFTDEGKPFTLPLVRVIGLFREQHADARSIVD